MDQCEYGPTAVIYPQAIWYGRLTPSDVPRIVEETILGGRVIEELLIPNKCLNTKGRVPWPQCAATPKNTAPNETSPEESASPEPSSEVSG